MNWRNRLRAILRSEPLSDTIPKPLATMGRQTVGADGYSLLELKRVGMTEAEARSLGLVVDKDRYSAIGTNVMHLRDLLR